MVHSFCWCVWLVYYVEMSHIICHLSYGFVRVMVSSLQWCVKIQDLGDTDLGCHVVFVGVKELAEVEKNTSLELTAFNSTQYKQYTVRQRCEILFWHPVCVVDMLNVKIFLVVNCIHYSVLWKGLNIKCHYSQAAVMNITQQQYTLSDLKTWIQ